MNNKRPIAEQSIVFIGFMGVGKTTVGKKLAEKLNRDFIDIDAAIEKEQGMSISSIFSRHGERYFREKEKQAVLYACKDTEKVISLGGGAFTQEAIRTYCLSHCLVVFLDIQFDSWVKRIDILKKNRPVLKGKSLEELKELYEQRQAAYAEHHVHVQTDSRSVNDIALHLKETISAQQTDGHL